MINDKDCVINFFKEILERNSEYSLELAKKFFDDCIGMGETHLNLLEIRGDWYIANTETMTLQDVDSFVDDLLNAYETSDLVREWFLELKENVVNIEIPSSLIFIVDYRNEFGDSYNSAREFYTSYDLALKRVQEIMGNNLFSSKDSGYSAVAIMNNKNEDLALYIYNQEKNCWENES